MSGPTLYSGFQSGGRLVFNGVSAERGNALLFSDVSFILNPGELLWIQGANGIGKTTLLRMAAGLALPQTGFVNLTFDTVKKRQNPADLVCYQGHQDGFKATLTAQEELSFWAKIYAYKAPLIDVFRKVGLQDRVTVPTGKLSAGQKRRLALARLVISQRCIWILDEPNAAMDSEGRALTESLIAEHIRNDGSVMIASHSAAKSLGSKTRRLILESS